MRRIIAERHREGVLVSHKDYRLLCKVARAAETAYRDDPNFRGVWAEDIALALDRLNAPAQTGRSKTK